MSSYTKDPDAVLDYTVDWASWLDTDEISTSTWIVPTGLTEVSDSKTTTTGTVFLSGGDIGVTYKVTNRITTNFGRTADKTISITVSET